MKTAVPLLPGLLAAASVLTAQSPESNSAATRSAAAARARSEATTAIKRGDSASALSSLRSTVPHGPHAAAEDILVVGQLCAIARELESAQPGAGRAAALAATEEGAKARARLSRRDAATLEVQLGELHEAFLGDAVKARAHFQSALTLDATRSSARQGLERINRLEALVQAKARENDALRRRQK